MLKRTPGAGLVIAGILSILIIIFFEDKARPFTMCQLFILYIISFLPSLGIAMLFDPNPKKAREDYMKINFYEE